MKIDVALEHLEAAARKVAKLKADDQRAITYLLTYPSMVKFGRSCPLDAHHFHLLAALAYGWMPRVVRIDPGRLPEALETLKWARRQKRDAAWKDIKRAMIEHLEACLGSMVGASKVLHFVNPYAFPIWDSRIEGLRKGGKARQKDMTVAGYMAYAKDVYKVRASPRFDRLYDQIASALQQKLGEFEIPLYATSITKVRAIEYALFVRSAKRKRKKKVV